MEETKQCLHHMLQLSSSKSQEDTDPTCFCLQSCAQMVCILDNPDLQEALRGHSMSRHSH